MPLSASLGRFASPMRSKICWRASRMSTPSSNVIVTTDRPNSEIDRWWIVPGTPLSARSSGIDTRRSTSSAGWPG